MNFSEIISCVVFGSLAMDRNPKAKTTALKVRNLSKFLKYNSGVSEVQLQTVLLRKVKKKKKAGGQFRKPQKMDRAFG